MDLDPDLVTNLLLTTVLVQCTAAILLNTMWRQRRRRTRIYNVHPIYQRRHIAGMFYYIEII
jgi:hypothetical protein